MQSIDVLESILSLIIFRDKNKMKSFALKICCLEVDDVATGRWTILWDELSPASSEVSSRLRLLSAVLVERTLIGVLHK